MWKGPDRVAAWMRSLGKAKKDLDGRGMLSSKYSPAQKAAVRPGFLYEFPWEPLGGAKYVLFLPFLLVIAAGMDDEDNFAFHMMTIVALRYLQVMVAMSLFHPSWFECARICFTYCAQLAHNRHVCCINVSRRAIQAS
jgi:hypothetical protein